MTSKKRNIKSSKWVLYLIESLVIIALSFLAYSNAIHNDFNLDDAYIVPLDSQNDIIKESPKTAIPKLLKSRYNEAEGATHGYRPLGKITMVFEYQLWGLNATYSHIVNIVLFGINVLLLLLLLRKLTTIGIVIPTAVIYIGLLLFVFHPIHTEVVCSIKNREEILCFIFLVTSLIFYLEFFKTSKYYYILPFVASLTLGMLAKETLFNVFGWLIILALVGSRNGGTKLNMSVFIFKTVVIIIVAARLYTFVLDFIPSTLTPAEVAYEFTQNPYASFSSIYSIPNGIQTLFFYLKKLFLPYPLLFYYGYDMLPMQNWKMALPYIGIIIAVILMVFVIKSYIDNKNILLPFWIAVFFISIFPFSNLINRFYVTGIVGERLVYQASFAFCMILAILIYNGVNLILKNGNSRQKKLAIPAVALPILIFYFILTFQRSADWENKITLFEKDIKHLSKSVRANSMLASAYMKSVDEKTSSNNEESIQKAKHYFKESIKVYPKYDDGWIKLGLIYARYQNNLDSALFCFSKVAQDSSNAHLESLEILGDIFQTQQRNEQVALRYYLQYWAISASNKRIYEKIQNILFKQSRFHDAILFAEIAIKNKWVEGYVDKADALFQMGNTPEAILNYQLALKNGYVSVEIENRIKRLE